MISVRKIRANRNNARASTGPRTAQGKARSARNALRHGLSVPVSSNPLLCKNIEDLAREIARPGASPKIQALARPLAEAQVDLNRVRDARHQAAVSQVFPDTGGLGYAGGRGPKVGRRVRIRRRTLGGAPPRPKSTSKGLDELEATLSGKVLLAFERYERRAFSRRNFALRALIEALDQARCAFE
jgi:hypothetical protein